jgi:ferredoxin
MFEYTEKIQKISEELLAGGKVDVVIGYRKGSIPGTNEPCMIKKPEDAKNLVWDSNCRLNLVNYITGRKDRVGIIAKGCESRNIVTHIQEKRITREQLVIIGVPCTGVTDKLKLSDLADGELTGVAEAGGQITVTSLNGSGTIDKNEILQDNCLSCTQRNPVIYDSLVSDLVEEQKETDKFAEVKKIEAMTPDEKWLFFDDLLSPCTRCYACRNACPLCYCPTCFVDESTPQWVGKGDDPVDIRTYHTLRAFHCAGRCTDCGACEAACPMNIKVRLFTGKLNKSCEERYGHEAGLSLDARPALDTFKLDDPEEFIR